MRRRPLTMVPDSQRDVLEALRTIIARLDKIEAILAERSGQTSDSSAPPMPAPEFPPVTPTPGVSRRARTVARATAKAPGITFGRRPRPSEPRR